MKSSSLSRQTVLTDAYTAAEDRFYRKFSAASRKYLNDFISLKCASDMLERGLFPNAKEITESFAAYHATKYLSDFDLKNPETTVVVVGDGTTPRTAATFAFRSAWNCWSIDPKLRKNEWDIKRLTCLKHKVEELTFIKSYCPILIVAVHSHAKLVDTVARFRSIKRVAVIAIPCCVPQKLHIPPTRRYRDVGIWSPKNEVLIWDSI